MERILEPRWGFNDAPVQNTARIAFDGEAGGGGIWRFVEPFAGFEERFQNYYPGVRAADGADPRLQSGIPVEDSKARTGMSVVGAAVESTQQAL
ncbi:MAG TPA: hypothetical protein VL860_00760 [Planctomycetota bacterium]|nr:hypothetical protein [Planctomycetota bacterium]